MATKTKKQPQHLEALDAASKTRIYRVEQLRKLASYELSLEAILQDPEMGSLEVADVLMVMPFQCVERHTALLPRSVDQTRKIIQKCQVRSGRKVNTLTEHSRTAILEAANEIAGHRAWIFEDDTPPTPRKRVQYKRSRPQALSALEKANAVRLERCRLRQQLRDGELTLKEALDQEAFATWQLGKLVVNLRRISPSRDSYLDRLSPAAAKKVLANHKISPLIKVEDLSEDSKRLLVMIYADARFCRPEKNQVPA